MPIVITPYWMSPENINDQQCLYMSDIWSTGITAIECAIGAPPLIELPSTRAMIQTSTKGLDDHFPLQENFSDEFVDFVFKCTELDPLKRPKAKELLNHPFVKKAEKLDRRSVMKDLVEIVEDDGDGNDEFDEKTKHFIGKYKDMF